HDFADGAQTMRTLNDAECVIAFSAFASDALREVADVILPIGLLPEIDGTLVNVDGKVQACSAGATMPGDTRAGWRVLRALGGLLQTPGFDFTEIAQVRAAMLPEAAQVQPSLRGAPGDWEPFTAKLPRTVEAPSTPEQAQTEPVYERNPLGAQGIAPFKEKADRTSAEGNGQRLVRLATVPIYRAVAGTSVELLARSAAQCRRCECLTVERRRARERRWHRAAGRDRCRRAARLRLDRSRARSDGELAALRGRTDYRENGMISRNQIGNRKQGTGNKSLRLMPFPVPRSPFP